MKKSLAVLLILSMLLSALPFAAYGQDLEDRGMKLERAIEIVKGYFSIPKECNQFTSGYEQNDYGGVWFLQWRSEKGDSTVNVRVDAGSGEIVGYNAYKPGVYEGRSASIPQISREQGEKIVREFIKKVAASKADQIKLQETEQKLQPGQVYHYYLFHRTINGVEYPSNTIRVNVNGFTGEVNDFNVQWENQQITPLQAKLTGEDAHKVLMEKGGFQLRYFKPQGDRGTSKPIRLVYEILNPRVVSVDAISGEVVMDHYYGPYYDRAAQKEKAAGDSGAYSKLEPCEQEEADEIAGLLTQEKALKIAEGAVELSDSFKLRSAHLFRDWAFQDLRVWAFSWSIEEKEHYGWANVEVDAKTGKVLAFDYNEGYNNEQQHTKTMKVKNREAAEKIVADFLKANYPETVGNLQLRDEIYQPIVPLAKEETENRPSYYFAYERLVNGIPYAQNYVNVSVNSYTGMVNSFRIRFVDEDFPAVDNILEKGEFSTDFFAKYPMELMYTRDTERNLLLLYKLQPLDSYRFDAVTGKMIGWDGEPVKESKDEEITDIQGHWAEDEINLLQQMDFIHLEEGAFKPDTQITQAEVIKMLVKTTNSYLNDSTTGNWYDNYYEYAKRSSLIHENEVNPSAAVTREEMAKFLTRSMMWDKIATLDIYTLEKYKDAAQVSQGYVGYAAITSELGLIVGNGDYWKPKATLKKGETAVVIVRYLKMEKKKN
jgi:hypothetical protein